MTRRTVAPTPFEPEFVEGLVDIFERKVVFNGVIGLRIVSIAPERVTGRIEMRPELAGHFG
jgi:hypothetical protein